VIFKKLALLAALTLIALPLSAGDPPRADEERAPARDEIPEILDYYMLSHLQERLGLTDAHNAKVVPLVMQYQKDLRGCRKGKMKSVTALKKLLKSGTATESQLVEHLNALRAIEAEDRGKLKKDLEAIDGELTVVQQAKFRVLEHEVERKFFQLMRDAMGPGGRARREPAPDKPHPKPDEPSATSKP
jgi:hypothetical protein